MIGICFANKIVIGICVGCQLFVVFNHCVIDFAPKKYILRMDNIIVDKRYIHYLLVYQK